MKYRKKPVVIDAVKWTGDNLDEIRAFVGASLYGEAEGQPTFVITTLEGSHVASLGDYIIKGVAGEFYPCKPAIFEATYSLEAA